MCHDSAKDLMRDSSLENDKLRKQIKKLESKCNEEKRLRLIAKMDLHFATEKLGAQQKVCVAVVTDEKANKHECDRCYALLEPDYTFCPGCGRWINWGGDA